MFIDNLSSIHHSLLINQMATTSPTCYTPSSRRNGDVDDVLFFKSLFELEYENIDALMQFAEDNDIHLDDELFEDNLLLYRIYQYKDEKRKLDLKHEKLRSHLVNRLRKKMEALRSEYRRYSPVESTDVNSKEDKVGSMEEIFPFEKPVTEHAFSAHPTGVHVRALDRRHQPQSIQVHIGEKISAVVANEKNDDELPTRVVDRFAIIVDETCIDPSSALY